MERIDSARQKLADLRAAKLDLLEALEEAETTEAKWDFLNLPESFCCSTATVKELSYYGILFRFFFVFVLLHLFLKDQVSCGIWE